jgi:hypothetical protein
MRAKELERKFALAIALSIALTSVSSSTQGPQQCMAQGVDAAKAARISADGYIAWWMHDATGYHPAIYLKLQNTSGADMSFKPIKFQGLFRDLKNGYVTVAREELRTEFERDREIYLLLEGPRAFELPIDKNSWPAIECKVMCRIGATDDDAATQDLLITKLSQEAMTDEEAKIKLSDYSYPHMVSRRHALPAQPTAPLVATALPLNGNGAAGHGKPLKHEHNHEGMAHFVSSNHLSGLGDDFYEFEQAFGKPIEFRYAHDTKWTWAHYEYGHLLSIFAGSRGHTSKVDFVVAILPADSVQQDSELSSLARSLAGKMRSQPLSSQNKTVKYTNSGRIQLTTASAPGYKMFAIAPRGASADESFYTLGVCSNQVPGEPRSVLADNAKRVAMLRLLAPVVADQDSD